MSRFHWFLPGLIVATTLFTVAFIFYMKSEKDAADAKAVIPFSTDDKTVRYRMAGGREVVPIAVGRNGSVQLQPVDPTPAPPLPWPTYDSGPLHPGEHLYELLTADDKGIYSRSIDLLPKLRSDVPPPPSPSVPPPPSK